MKMAGSFNITLEIRDNRQLFTAKPISPEHKHLKNKIISLVNQINNLLYIIVLYFILIC